MFQHTILSTFFLSLFYFSQSFAQQTSQLQLAGDITADQATTILQKAEKIAESQMGLVQNKPDKIAALVKK